MPTYQWHNTLIVPMSSESCTAVFPNQQRWPVDNEHRNDNADGPFCVTSVRCCLSVLQVRAFRYPNSPVQVNGSLCPGDHCGQAEWIWRNRLDLAQIMQLIFNKQRKVVCWVYLEVGRWDKTGKKPWHPLQILRFRMYRFEQTVL